MKKTYEVEPFVKVKRGQAITNSVDVADNFGKRHDRVLDKIFNLHKNEEIDSAFFAQNFKQTTYVDDRNRKQPMFEMTRDGFSFLAMGFTGKKASQWKIKYINAFNAMEEVLLNQSNMAWKELRNQGKTARLEMTDSVKDFVEYAESQGSKNARFYYSTITKATYKALFLIESKFKQPFRDMLDSMQLSYLQTAEFIARNALKEGMAMRLTYKDIYQHCKNRVEAFAATVGATKVINNDPRQKLIAA